MRFEGLQRAKGILVNDFQSAVGGLATLFGSAGAQDEVHLCLGFLSSEQTVASPGCPNRYLARVMNPQGLFGDVRLVLDIYQVAPDSEVGSHLGFSVAEFPLRGRSALDVCWSFDWQGEVDLAIDSAPPVPLTFERQADPVSLTGFWRLTAEVSVQGPAASRHSLSIVENVG
jgi:hypothetical protein